MNRKARGLLDALGELPQRLGTSWERLREDLGKYSETEFGKAHGFSDIRSEEDFRPWRSARLYDFCQLFVVLIEKSATWTFAVAASPFQAPSC